jgi:ketosteroid isomerase-like protein
MTEDSNAIAAIIEQHGRNFLARDADALIDAFDDTYPHLTHLPTERMDALRGFAEISEYYRGIVRAFCPLSWDVSDVIIDFLGADFAFALCRVSVPYKIEELPADSLPPYHAGVGHWEGRCRYVFRRRGDAWKIIHLEDSTCENFRPGQLQQFYDRRLGELRDLAISLISQPSDT